MRLDEGNELARLLRQTMFVSGEYPTDEDQQRCTESVRTWNRACVATVTRHLSHRAPLMDAPFRRDHAQFGRGIVPWASLLLEEVTEKIDRMAKLQRELAQSSKEAISSQVQT